MGKFNKGLFLGGVLGAGLVWLNTTKQGREKRDLILDYAADVYVDIKNKLMDSDTWDDMNKNKYVKMVQEVVDTYAVDNKLASTVRDAVVKLVSSQWKHLSAEVTKGREGMKKKKKAVRKTTRKTTRKKKK